MESTRLPEIRTVDAPLNRNGFSQSGKPLSRRWCHGALRQHWLKSRYPQQIERRDRLMNASDDLERIVHLFVAWTDGLTDAKAITVAEARENEARSAEKIALP